MENLKDKNIVKNRWWLSHTNILIFITITIFILFSLIAKGFFSVVNFFIILRQMSVIATLGLGLTFVLTVGEIDVTVGTLPALSACTFAVLLKNNFSLTFAILISFLIAVFFGLTNGLITVYTNLPGIIVTLATIMIIRGIAYIVSGQTNVLVHNKMFTNIFGGEIFGFPVIAIWVIFFGIIGFIILQKVKFGRNLSYIGENKLASYFSGIRIHFTILIAFLISAIFSFFAALLQVAQSGIASPYMLPGSLMAAVAATLIGGTSLSGGKGNIVGTIIGAFFLATLSNGFLIFGVVQWVLYSINGIVVIAAMSYSYRTVNKF
ncbi:MAG: ABC transporter permease [Actinobacteria bacterium]|nr:ABC transporter permease [Actinomycetota bacterium]